MAALILPLLTMATTPHAGMWQYLHILYVYILACIFAQGSYIQDMVYITLSVTQIFAHFPCLYTIFHLCSRFLHRIWCTLHSLSHNFQRVLPLLSLLSPLITR